MAEMMINSDSRFFFLFVVLDTAGGCSMCISVESLDDSDTDVGRLKNSDSTKTSHDVITIVIRFS
jgi:hypothetical protein